LRTLEADQATGCLCGQVDGRQLGQRRQVAIGRPGAVNNRRILETLRHGFSTDEAAMEHWCGTWIGAGFEVFEALVRG
jgi:hypothetical protein